MAKRLWNEYLFLTREMAKFLDKQDYDLFFEIMRQRESLQQKIDECTDDYKKTPEGREVLTSIRAQNQVIMQKLRLFLNQAKQQQSVSQAYDIGGSRPVGVRFDRQS
ncbi:MAG: hypothetical protein GX348_00295 [Veillonellaceae bacterium]|nr:hypothetical protein [Veillonellaceae bacterium]